MKKLNLPKKRTFSGPALIWKRILAFFIDLFIINFIILFPFKGFFNNIVPGSFSFKESLEIAKNPELNSILIAIAISSSILMILYFMILEKRFGQSAGKMLTNIYIVSETKKISFLQLLTRNLFLIPFFPFILLWVLDPLFMVFTKENKRLSEVLSKTKVVETFQY